MQTTQNVKRKFGKETRRNVFEHKLICVNKENVWYASKIFFACSLVCAYYMIWYENVWEGRLNS